MSEQKCPYQPATKPRPELPPMTARIAALPLDDRGYPVPFFVAWIDGKPEFRAADGSKWMRCYKENLCWVCGQKVGRFTAFLIGPMCAITHTTAEPPSHVDCAEWSVRGCPFLSRPAMVRRDNNMPEECHGPAGIMIERNPGVTCMWITTGYKLFRDPDGRPLITVGTALSKLWYREGRLAVRAEILESIRTGVPALEALCITAEDKADFKARHESVLAEVARWPEKHEAA